MKASETFYLPIEVFGPGQLITMPGTKNEPFMRTISGYINLITKEKIDLEKGMVVQARPLTRLEMMKKYKMSLVQYDGWMEEVDKIKKEYNVTDQQSIS